MRTIKELLQVMLDNQFYFKGGLCTWNVDLVENDVITHDEYHLLRNYILNNKPITFHRIFGFDNYFWERGDIKPRIKWIKHHISIN